MFELSFRATQEALKNSFIRPGNAPDTAKTIIPQGYYIFPCALWHYSVTFVLVVDVHKEKSYSDVLGFLSALYHMLPCSCSKEMYKIWANFKRFCESL